MALAAEAVKIPAGYTALKPLSAKPVRSFDKLPKFALNTKLDYAAVLNTNRGQMVIDLYESDTPTSVNSFVWLAQHRFYDGLLFHRVIDKFVVQGGDPNTAKPDRNLWGQGGPGYYFGVELRKKLKFDSKGILGMARGGSKESNGSQFYLTLEPTPALDGQYTVFGKVTEGLDVLDKITKYESPDPKGKPDQILSVTIITKKK